MRLAIVSDIHYAGAAERALPDRALVGITNPVTRTLIRAHRHFIWLRDPRAHNHLLDRFIENTADSDYVVANGDFSCNSAYVGMADDAAHDSARECLAKLRTAYPSCLLATYGDHELGKKKLGCDEGGLRIASWRRCLEDLELEPFWQLSIGRYVLMGVVSTLIALPVFKNEALADEWNEWTRLRAIHLDRITSAFRSLDPADRLILFCHDPTALPYLLQLEEVRCRMNQIERTVIGHLHSRRILQFSRVLSGVPRLKFGHTVQRITTALRQVRQWQPFNLLLCPSPAGIQLFKDGGYYTADVDPDAVRPAQFRFHPLSWSSRLEGTEMNSPRGCGFGGSMAQGRPDRAGIDSSREQHPR